MKIFVMSHTVHKNGCLWMHKIRLKSSSKIKRIKSFQLYNLNVARGAYRKGCYLLNGFPFIMSKRTRKIQQAKQRVRAKEHDTGRRTSELVFYLEPGGGGGGGAQDF